MRLLAPLLLASLLAMPAVQAGALDATAGLGATWPPSYGAPAAAYAGAPGDACIVVQGTLTTTGWDVQVGGASALPGSALGSVDFTGCFDVWSDSGALAFGYCWDTLAQGFKATCATRNCWVLPLSGAGWSGLARACLDARVAQAGAPDLRLQACASA
jgi:hypothetical protein